MSTGTAPPLPLTLARAGFADAAEADEFVETLQRFESGELGPEEWRAFRLTRGNYGQRQETAEAQMVRIKLPQGWLEASQLITLAAVSERYARGFVHLTTRQDVQLNFVNQAEIGALIGDLATSGLTTREACGNAVRNITGCPWAGVAEDELFDVTPYAEALTRYLLRHPLASRLPRKFKMAFEGCPRDHALTAINDLGFRAQLQNGARGFRVTVGGGTSTLTRSGQVLVEFLPAAELLGLTAAVLTVFDQRGDREHRQRNRLKFLIKTLGFETFREHVEQALAALRAQGLPALPFAPEAPPEIAVQAQIGARTALAELARVARESQLREPGPLPVVEPCLARDELGLRRFVRTNVRTQRQAGFVAVTVVVPLGDATAGQLRALARVAQSFGDGLLRATPGQNLVLRFVRREHVAELFDALSAIGLARTDAETLVDPVSCPGAETCRLAVTRSRGVGRQIAAHFATRPELVAALPGADVRISGCPNGCGQHHVATFGLQGSVRKHAVGALPQYFLSVGGGTDAEGAHFGRLAAKLPARRVPLALERLSALYATERSPDEDAPSFFRRVDLNVVKPLLADLEASDTLGPEDVEDLE